MSKSYSGEIKWTEKVSGWIEWDAHVQGIHVHINLSWIVFWALYNWSLTRNNDNCMIQRGTGWTWPQAIGQIRAALGKELD